MQDSTKAAVYLSGLAGRAFIVTDGSVRTFRAFQQEIDLATIAQFKNFINFFADVISRQEEHPYASARRELDYLCRRSRCLNFLVEALDITASNVSRRGAARAADRLLSDQAVREDVTTSLHDAPPPADADYEGTAALAVVDALRNVETVCQLVHGKQAAIKKVRASWDGMLAQVEDQATRADLAQFARTCHIVAEVVLRGAAVVLEDLAGLRSDVPLTPVAIDWVLPWLRSLLSPNPSSGTRHGLLCDDVRRVVYFYLDGELSESGTIKLDQHLAMCPDCEYRVVLHRRLRNLFHRHLTRLLAPPHLKDRLSRTLRALQAH